MWLFSLLIYYLKFSRLREKPLPWMQKTQYLSIVLIFKSLLASEHTSWCFPSASSRCIWEAGYYLNEGMNLKSRFFDETVIFFHPIVLVICGKEAFLFSIFSLKYRRRPCLHDVLNLSHIVFSFLNPLFEITNAISDLDDIIPNACSPKEIQLIETVKGLVSAR